MLNSSCPSCPSSAPDCLQGRAARLSLAAAYALLCAGGLALNLAVVCVVGGFRKLRTASNAFIVNGCVADLLVCAVWMPQEAVAVSTGGGVGPPALRALREALLLLGITVSLLSHSLIAVNRYVLITKSPGTYQALYQKRHTEWMIAGSWLISLASLLPWISGFGSREEVCRALASLSASSASPPPALASASLFSASAPSFTSPASPSGSPGSPFTPPTSPSPPAFASLATPSPASVLTSASSVLASSVSSASGPPASAPPAPPASATSASFTMGLPLLAHPPSAGTLALTILGQTAVVLYCYFKIFRRVQSSVKRVSVLNFQLVNSLPCAFPRKDRRLGLCVLAVCFVFLLTTQPVCWTLAAAMFTHVPAPLWTFSWLLFCTVFVSNPFLYTWKNEEFRRSLRCVVRGELWRGSTVGVEPSTVSSISHLLPRQSSRRAFLSQNN